MTEAATDTAAKPDKKKAKDKNRKTPVRRPITVMVPVNIADLEAEDPVIDDSPPGEDENGKKVEVSAVELTPLYHVYIVPGGPGQKKAIRSILSKHNVDLRNIVRVRMFAGEKAFRVETQYNIRF